MKKGIIAILSLFLLSGCSFLSSSSTEENKILETPSLKLDEKGMVSWDNIENAEYYNYIINAGDVKTTTLNEIELKDKSNISVQAVGKNYVSNWSNAVTFYDTSDVIIEGSNKYHQVYFHNANYNSINVKNGDKVNKPNNPYKENHKFDNWYKDPFYTTLFDFNEPITKRTIIYANYIKDELIDNVYYWIKANDKMSASNQSSFTSNSGWRFIPLIENNNSKIKEFSAIVNVSNASINSVCQFLVMDGFDDNSGRTYYKNGNNDFSISENGTYRITFSVETLYLLNGLEVNVKFEKLNSQSKKYSNEYKLDLETPVIEVDSNNNMAYFSEIDNADGYEVIVNNGVSKIIKENVVKLNKKEHISVRAIKDNNIYSKWSVPKANINYINNNSEEVKTHAYVYFYESNQNAKKVEINTYVNELTISKKGYKFLGWYLDLAKTNKVTFPYKVEDNVVFYPKFENSEDLYNKEYYKFVDSSGRKLSGLQWNISNYDFYEYKTEEIILDTNTSYYVKTLDDKVSYGPYKVEEKCSYTVYFSEENIWDINTDKARNVYFLKNQIDIYFTDALNWSGPINAYYWNSTTNKYYSPWPGEKMEYVKTNSYGQDIYKISLDIYLYDYIIFNNGSLQTIDLSLKDATNNSAFYTKNEKENGKYKCGTYTFTN